MFRETVVWALIFFLISPSAGTAFDRSGALLLAAQKPAPAPFMAEAALYEDSLRVKKAVFKNGLTVLVYETYTQPLVSVQTYISGGFLDDPDGMIGISELTARAREYVGEKSPAGAIRGRARALGGVFHGSAGPRHSRFEITVPSARWKQALGIQAEAMLTPFDGEILRRDVAWLTENMRYESARPNVAEKGELLALAFDEPRFAPYSQSLEIASEKIIEFHKNRYVPSAATLVIAGDVRAAEALNEVVRIFNSKNDGLKTGNDAAAEGKAPEPAGEFRYRAMRSGAAFPKVLLGFAGPGEKSADYRALEVASAILGIGETSVLHSRLRDRKELIFSARAEMESFNDAGLFSVELEMESQNIDMAEVAFFTEAEILKRAGPSETDLARAVAQLERLWWERRETVGDMATALAGAEFQLGWKRMDDYIAEIRKVTAADVKRVITRYLTFSNCALLEYIPYSAAERNTTAAAIHRTLESLLRPALDEEIKSRAGELEPDYIIPPAGAAFRPNEIRHSFKTASILRGPEIYIREDRSSPLIEMGLFFTGGKAQESEANAGITGLMLEMMLSGERENRQLEIYGGRLSAVVTDDYFGFFLSIPARHSSGGFERIKQAVKSPVFDKAKLEKLGRIAAARSLASTNDQESENRRLKEALFRGHVYAAAASVTPASLKNISTESVRGWYEENVRNVKPFAAIVGDTEGTSLASWFVNELSGSRMNERKNVVSSPKPTEKTEVLEYDGRAGHSAILFGFQAPSAAGVDVYEAFILKYYLQYKLNEAESASEKKQERETLLMRISCEYQPLSAGGSLIVSAETKTGEEARGVENIRGKITRIAALPVHYADFLAAQALAAGSYLAENQTRRAQIENLTNELLAGLRLEEYRDVSQNIEQVGEEDFKAFLSRVLDMNKAVVMVVRGGR